MKDIPITKYKLAANIKNKGFNYKTNSKGNKNK